MLNAKVSLPHPTNYTKPKYSMPIGACDSHTHVIPESGWTLVDGANYTPAAAIATSHLHMLDALSLDRGVVVQPSIFGTDNASVIAAIASAPDRLRGVAVVDSSMTDEVLQRLHNCGIRGARFNVMLGGGGGLASMIALSPRLAKLGWHAEILVDGQLLPEIFLALCDLPCRLVIDHMASLNADVDMKSPPMIALFELVRARDTWVKLSGTYRLAADYRDTKLAERGRALVALAPKRMVWGSDWPHVACSSMPDAGCLLNLLSEWFDNDERVLANVLSINPENLFDFPAIKGETK